VLSRYLIQCWSSPKPPYWADNSYEGFVRGEGFSARSPPRLPLLFLGEVSALAFSAHASCVANRNNPRGFHEPRCRGSCSAQRVQKRRLRVTCEHIDKLLVEAEAVLNQSASKAAFPRYQSEIPLANEEPSKDTSRESGAVAAYLGMAKTLKACSSLLSGTAIHVDLTFIEVAAEELYPKYMRGYGPVPEAVATD